jgi:hypothetical protein
MNAQSTAFVYDDFERYLLEAARIDQAPSDLPARLGVALGLGVPILVATEAVTVLPTTTSLSGAGAAELSSAAAPTGLFASLKASLGVGASTLWNAAAKGIAVGVLSGAALVGTSRAVVKIANLGAHKSPTAATASVVNRSAVSSVSARGAVAVAPAAAVESDPNEQDPVAGDTAANNRPVAIGGGYDQSALGPATDDEPSKPVVRLARPVFPEKTTAVARYPLLYDDVSALYDAPKKAAARPAVAAVNPEPGVDPADIPAIRAKTIQHSRTLLGQSKAALALSELDSYRKLVGDRHFGVDELLLRIEALAMLGRAKEAQLDVAIVERLAPNSNALRQAQLLARSRFVR